MMRPTAWTTRRTSTIHLPWGTTARGTINLLPLQRPNQKTPHPRLPNKTGGIDLGRHLNPLSIGPIAIFTYRRGKRRDGKKVSSKYLFLNHSDLTFFSLFCLTERSIPKTLQWPFLTSLRGLYRHRHWKERKGVRVSWRTADCGLGLSSFPCIHRRPDCPPVPSAQDPDHSRTQLQMTF